MRQYRSAAAPAGIRGAMLQPSPGAPGPPRGLAPPPPPPELQLLPGDTADAAPASTSGGEAGAVESRAWSTERRAVSERGVVQVCAAGCAVETPAVMFAC